jgi:hypothetical protein
VTGANLQLSRRPAPLSLRTVNGRIVNARTVGHCVFGHNPASGCYLS